MLGKDKISTVSQVAESQPNIKEKKVLKSISKLQPRQLKETKSILEKKSEASDVGVNENGFLAVDDCITIIKATNSLYGLQHTEKVLHDPA